VINDNYTLTFWGKSFREAIFYQEKRLKTFFFREVILYCGIIPYLNSKQLKTVIPQIPYFFVKEPNLPICELSKLTGMGSGHGNRLIVFY